MVVVMVTGGGGGVGDVLGGRESNVLTPPMIHYASPEKLVCLSCFHDIQEVEKRMRGNNKTMKETVQEENLPKIQANVANFLGAEALLDFLCILCALGYAWDLASSITFA